MDFSAIALRIKTLGDKEAVAALETIDQKAQQTAQQVNEIFDNTLYKGSLRDAERDYDRLVNAWKNGSDQAAAAVQNVSTQISGLGSRLQQVAVSGSLVGADLAEGGSYGVMRFARTIANLGFIVNPVVGGITLLAATVGEALFTSLEKSKKEADAFRKSLTDLINAGNVAKIGEKIYDVEVGTAAENYEDGLVALKAKLATVEARFHEMRLGGQSAQIQELQGKIATAQSKLDELLRAQKLAMRSSAYYDDQNTAANRASAKADRDALKGLIASEDERLRLMLEQHRVKDLTVRLVGDQEMPELDQLRERQDGINFLLGTGNISLDERLKLERQLRDVERDIADQEERIDKALLKTIHAAKPENRERTPSASVAQALADLQNARDEMKHGLQGAERDFYDAIDELQKAITHKLDGDLKNAVEQGFRRAFDGEGLRGFFKGFGEVIMASLGDVFVQLGESLMSFGAIASTIAAAISSLGIFSGPAAIAAGAALIALGVGMQAGASSLSHASSRGGYSSGGYGNSTVVTYGIVNPVSQRAAAAAPAMHPRPAIHNHNYIIGPADPVAQRMWDELQRRSLQRGSIRGA